MSAPQNGGRESENADLQDEDLDKITPGDLEVDTSPPNNESQNTSTEDLPLDALDEDDGLALSAYKDKYVRKLHKQQVKRGEIDLDCAKRLERESQWLFWIRIGYSGLLLLLCVAWVIFISWFIIKCGKQQLKLGDNVQIALITTTTVNVLGIYYIVANWLFPKKIPSEETDATKN